MAPLKNHKHERFCQEILLGKNATEAYITAGYKASGAAARANASRLLTEANICDRILELQKGSAEKAEISKAGFTKDLLRLAAKAEALEEGSGLSVARQAIMDAAKLNGMIIDRKETGEPGEFEKMNATELRASIAADLAALEGEDSPAEVIGRGRAARERLQ